MTRAGLHRTRLIDTRAYLVGLAMFLRRTDPDKAACVERYADQLGEFLERHDPTPTETPTRTQVAACHEPHPKHTPAGRRFGGRPFVNLTGLVEIEEPGIDVEVELAGVEYEDVVVLDPDTGKELPILLNDDAMQDAIEQQRAIEAERRAG